MEDELLTIGQAAELLGVSRPTFEKIKKELVENTRSFSVEKEQTLLDMQRAHYEMLDTIEPMDVRGELAELKQVYDSYSQ